MPALFIFADLYNYLYFTTLCMLLQATVIHTAIIMLVECADKIPVHGDGDCVCNV